nr:hypothetical protein [Micromonospora sp. DSM 115978]
MTNPDAAGVHAVWTGRFQPVHIGHLTVLRHSVATLAMPHVAVLTAHFGWTSPGDYGERAAQAYTANRNPFTMWERVTLMRLALAGAGLSHQVAVMAAPRHDLDWPAVAQFYPPQRIICLTAKDDFESAKASLWRSRGEQLHIFAELGPADVLTTTQIRARVAAGADWRQVIPESCHQYFAAIDGPRRVFGCPPS